MSNFKKMKIHSKAVVGFKYFNVGVVKSLRKLIFLSSFSVFKFSFKSVAFIYGICILSTIKKLLL